MVKIKSWVDSTCIRLLFHSFACERCVVAAAMHAPFSVFARFILIGSLRLEAPHRHDSVFFNAAP